MSLSQRASEILTAIDSACKKAGRGAGEARLLAVSKLQPVSLIEEAYAAGLRDFGENYAQELVEKKAKLAHLKDIRWHLIGHLQTNKAKAIVGQADFFHALDSLKLLNELGRRNAGREPLPVFVQVNVDDEESKSGIALSEAGELVRAAQSTRGVVLRGLMCIPQRLENAKAMRPAFRKLASLAKELKLEDCELSMGMSEDFEVAIEEGATWVRVGRKLFGERKEG